MKKLLLIFALMLCIPSVSAMDMPELIKTKNCASCHAVDKKIVGPAWLKVSKRYAGNKEALALLANKIKQGGAGVWGAMPMPAQSVTKEEAASLAEYILKLDSMKYAAQ